MKIFLARITDSKPQVWPSRPQLTAAISVKPTRVTTLAVSPLCNLLCARTYSHAHAHRLYYTLATCRGFCCSAPPCSLKPHGAPPERDTTISSATIPAHSLLCVWGCVCRSALLRFLKVWEYQWVRLLSLCAQGESLHPWADAGGWLAFIWNAVSEGGHS